MHVGRWTFSGNNKQQLWTLDVGHCEACRAILQMIWYKLTCLLAHMHHHHRHHHRGEGGGKEGKGVCVWAGRGGGEGRSRGERRQRVSLGAFSDHKKTSGKNVAPWAGP